MKLGYRNIYIVDGKEKTKEEINPVQFEEIKKELMQRAIKATGAVEIMT